ncbi:hypothetical protein F5148DRAFT_1188855 [Russula earlei]|uniref:Uncharacterized protein n=1 Tax=Russula earlei TaxID=71964 RepID=A0ACC0UCL4_9AGAM|nr:hypothetical protein F5148DRAFT_1188855 [Russula earlei]
MRCSWQYASRERFKSNKIRARGEVFANNSVIFSALKICPQCIGLFCLTGIGLIPGVSLTRIVRLFSNSFLTFPSSSITGMLKIWYYKRRTRHLRFRDILYVHLSFSLLAWQTSVKVRQARDAPLLLGSLYATCQLCTCTAV